jgi:hypothetical protein
MKETPILFNAAMVKAILEGRKTMTRRVFNPDQIAIKETESGPYFYTYAKRGSELTCTGQGPFIPNNWLHYCPYGQPGDKLYVKETFGFPATYDRFKPSEGDKRWPIYYHADKSHGNLVRWTDEEQELGKLRPSIFMPRWASRIALEVTGVKVERVMGISEGDAMADGGWTYAKCPIHKNPTASFKALWDSINSSRGYGWDKNPYVWAVSFRRITP